MNIVLTEGIKVRGASKLVGTELFTDNARFTLKANVTESGSVWLTDKATRLLALPCEITADDKKLTIRQGKTIFSCPVGGELFALPVFDDEDVEYKKISAEAIAAVANATGENALANLFFAGDCLMATNEHRLHVITIDTVEATIPLKGMFGATKEIGVKDGFAFLKGDSFIQKLALSNNVISQWKEKIPATIPLLSVNRKEFLTALKSLFPAMTPKNEALMFGIDHEGIAMSIVGELTGMTFYAVKGDKEANCLVNAVYLADALESAPADAVTIGNCDKQIIVECDGFKAVVMCMKG